MPEPGWIRGAARIGGANQPGKYIARPCECFGKLGGRFLPFANAAAQTPSRDSEKTSGGQNANASGFSGVSTGTARDPNGCATRGLL